MNKTLLGIFDHPAAAQHAMEELHASGLPIENISIILRTEEVAREVGAEGLGAGDGAAFGALWGGLIGLAALLIPGVGPFVAGGAIFAALTGAATGAVVGGIAGALMQHTGISKETAEDYERMVHDGKALLAVKIDNQNIDIVRRILAHAGASSIRDNQTDIAGSGAPIHMSAEGLASLSAETDLAPGGATVRGSQLASSPESPGMPAPSPAGVPHVHTVPPIASEQGQRQGTVSGQEATNIRAGTEDTYGTNQPGMQNGAIIAEGWNQIDSLNERESKSPPAHRHDEDNDEDAEKRS